MPARSLLILLSLTALLGGCSLEQWLSGPTDRQSSDAGPTATRRALPTSTPAPTMPPWRWEPASTATATTTPRPAPTPSPTPSPTPVTTEDLQAQLPTSGEVPEGLVLEAEDPLVTLDEAAREADDSAWRALLTREAYRRGASREYRVPEPGLGDYLGRMLAFEARALELGSVAGADAALDWQVSYAQRRPGWDLQPVSAPALGQRSVALAGLAEVEGTEVQVAALFVREGRVVYRYIGISGRRDPMPATVETATLAFSSAR